MLKKEVCAFPSVQSTSLRASLVDCTIPMWGPQVQSLVRRLRAYMPLSIAKKQNLKKKKKKSASLEEDFHKI